MSDTEQCDRCKSEGHDRRTLWMACFYDMKELGLPFKEKVLFHANLEELTKVKDAMKIDLQGGQSLVLAAGTVRSSGELTPHGIYTLRVCKRCRGEWLGAIQKWFKEAPEGEDHDSVEPQEESSIGTGIFVRENGALREVTEEEWYEKNPGREPVRVIK